MIPFLPRLILGGLALGCLGGCGKGDDKAGAPPVRPVLSVVVAESNARQIGYAGTIQPQFSADLGFQALGAIVAFNVDIGDLVKTGQVLARIDATALDLLVRSSEADLAKAQTQFINADASERRISTLFDQKVSTQAELDAVRQEKATASANVQAAEANLANAREQRGYASLSTDMDGVVTEKIAQVGQTVSAGQKVLTVARTDVREAVVDLSDSVAGALSVGAPFEIRLQVDPSIRVAGKVREIAPQADAATRTYRVKITLDRVIEPFRLGSTITAFQLGAAPKPTIEIPRSAVFERDGATMVWIVDQGAKAVRQVEVRLTDRDGPSAEVTSGISVGDRVVTAGVHSLAKDQVVKIGEDAKP